MDSPVVNKGATGLQIINGQHTLEEKWATLHFGEVKTSTNKQQHIFDAQVYLDDLDPAAVRVELYADGMRVSVFHEIRFHGRGGQGMVSAAVLLALAAFEDHFESQAFPGFGSERRGAPVEAYVRISSTVIRVHKTRCIHRMRS